jgi:hypothetical protein
MKSLGQPEIRRSVIERVGKLGADHNPLWGRMSAHQMVCHLTDSFKVATGERPISSKSGWKERNVFKFIALYVPAPWPKDVPTMPEADQFIGGTRPIEFEQDRRELLRLIDDVCDRDAARLAATHPYFGPMTCANWLRWGFLHADHHLRQFGL